MSSTKKNNIMVYNMGAYLQVRPCLFTCERLVRGRRSRSRKREEREIYVFDDTIEEHRTAVGGGGGRLR
jgi:hypothetical protein